MPFQFDPESKKKTKMPKSSNPNTQTQPPTTQQSDQSEAGKSEDFNVGKKSILI
jgi:hypothetical protein